ncbi:MAG: hypothetical protein HOP16_12800 [Acidobacteria bacterium]|nr:hypothetical protein [Acidobacteriota bacterium]
MNKIKSAKEKPASHAFRVSTDEIRRKYRQERAVEMPDRLERRVALAPELAPRAAVNVSREDGYVVVPAGRFEMGAVLAASHAMLATADVAGKQADAHKAFLISLGEQRAWSLDSPILQLGLRPEIVAAAASYLGMVPILQYANFMYSSYTGEELLKSQLYHCDSDEAEQIKVFVLCDEVTPATGPLTFLPASQSQVVRDRTGYRYKNRLTDQEVSDALGGLDSEVTMTGLAGTTAFIDTSRCLHYGSRFQDRSAQRLVVMLQYVTPLAFLYTDDHRSTARFRHLVTPESDELTSLLLGVQ